MNVFQRLMRYEPKDFIYLFLEKNDLHPLFREVRDRTTHEVVYKDEGGPPTARSHSHFVVFDIPGYYQLTPFPGLQQKSLKSFKGSLICLSRYASFSDFLSKKFSSKQRAELLRQKRKLNHSFEVREQIYYGSISKAVYDQLFDEFKVLLTRRFREKGIKNDDLPHWEHYRRTFYPMVNQKRACISVFYHKARAISFSVNLIYGDTLYGYLKSYDVDFYRYSLGVLEMLSLLKWAYSLNLKKFDLLKGQYPYKSKLIDEEYFFHKTILAQKASPVSSLTGYITYLRIDSFYRLIRLLKMIGVDNIYNKLGTLWYRWKNPVTSSPNYQIIALDDNTKEDQCQLLDPGQMSELPLKRPLYDFLFSSGERLSEVKVFSLLSDPKTFVFKGRASSRAVSMDDTPLKAGI